jgi:hypothetical protein
MEGGTISGNTGVLGGGVGVWGRFSKTGGTIYGSDASPTSLKNTATSGNTNGHAVHYEDSGGSNQYYRNDTLDAGEDISTGDLSVNWTKVP